MRIASPSSLCMVSPWMEHGTVLNYLKTHGHTNLDKLLYEIAQGLEYLHSHNVVHGDLRGTNILIKEDWSACLTDFGLSILSDVTSTMSTNRGGSAHWMAPELLDPDRFGIKFARTAATDVYAFGCVCIELYTERPPFSNVSETAALLKVINGERPERPPGPPAMSDTLWQHVTEFWAENPTTRPSTQSVVQAMTWPPTDPNHSRPQFRFGPRPAPLVPQSPPGLTPVKDSFPPDFTSTAAKTAIPPDTPSSVPLSTDDESEKNWLLPPVSNGPPSSRLLDLLSVLADGGIGTTELVGAEHQRQEVTLREAPLVNPEVRGLTVHVGTETLPVWQDAQRQEAMSADPPSPQPVRRRRHSSLSTTTVVDSEGVLIQRPSRPSPIHVQDLQDLVGTDHQWPEVQLHEASLVDPEARELTVHVGTETLPVWQDAKRQEAVPADFPSPQPVRRRRGSSPSTTTTVDSEGLSLQRPSRPRSPPPTHVPDLVGAVHQWPEVKFQEASLANPEARGLTVHVGTEPLSVLQDAKRQEAPAVDPEVGHLTSLSPVRRRRRSLLSTTAVVDSEGVLLQRPSRPHSPSPIHMQDLHSHYRGKSAPEEGLILATFRELKTDKLIHDSSSLPRRAKWWRAKSLDAFLGILPTKIPTSHAPRTAEIQLIDQYEVLYDYSAAPDDPNEISFYQGDLVDLVEKQDFEWWQVRKADGSFGIAPSNCLRYIASSASTQSSFELNGRNGSMSPADDVAVSPSVSSGPTPYTPRTPDSAAVREDPRQGYKYQAIARFSYDRADATELSFEEKDILDIFDVVGTRWKARKEDGSTGFVPSNCFYIL
ncbi:Kinase-like protein [Mycena sanguinolenta]|uniref:mitogen-activated protein kinase kinase kinase n=1 Tax=Mycena sanguinolenta TaxID=230812 RepID=A0A8H7DJ93_9AGAR|nr:Kinase-like protein [Mycena sanguinolenta]